MPRSTEAQDADLTFDYNPAKALLQPRAYQAEVIQALYDSVRVANPGARLYIEVATGGGKNLISNDVTWTLLGEGRRILRVTLNWALAAQAAADVCNRHPDAREQISFVGGGAGSRAMDGLRKGVDGQFVFTTIQTWNARRNGDFASQEFDIIVIDELHWGEEAPLYDALHERYAEKVVFVGLTATPRRWTRYERAGRPYDLPTLVSLGYLAEPRLVTIQTGVPWDSRRTSAHGDVTAGSLRCLATSAERNELVVSTYVTGAREYGKTILFACNIDHAEALTQMFVTQGVGAAALHSKMKDGDRIAVASGFRRGRIRVLVNVATAVHGLDIPDIKTVMLVRPTASDILMAQMIGRGTRLAPGKTSFFLLDFVDNATTHGGVPLVRPDGFIGSRVDSGARGAPISEHGSRVASLATFPTVEGYDELAGLPVHPQQTFGIEFELTSADFAAGMGSSSLRWQAVAHELHASLRAANLPTATSVSTGHGGAKDNTLWNVEYDGSCGWEITSRILRGCAGFIEVADACKVIQQAAARCGLNVSVRTGTHVHLGWKKQPVAIRHLLATAAYFEPALLSLVAPSRANNRYATSVRRVFKQARLLVTNADWADFLRPYEKRYLAVNPAACSMATAPSRSGCTAARSRGRKF